MAKKTFLDKFKDTEDVNPTRARWFSYRWFIVAFFIVLGIQMISPFIAFILVKAANFSTLEMENVAKVTQQWQAILATISAPLNSILGIMVGFFFNKELSQK
jgi:hypothetical protein